MYRINNKIIAAAAFTSLLLGVAILPAGARGRAPDKGAAPVIRVTPPAPVIDDAARLTELTSRRSRVAAKVGAKGLLVLFSTEPRVYTNDVDYEYRQENNLYY